METTNNNPRPPKISSWDWLRRIPKEDLPWVAEIITCYTDDLQPYIYIFGDYKWGKVLKQPRVEKLIQYAEEELKPGRDSGSSAIICSSRQKIG